ncbi:MAG: pyruvate dehydrogenase (acetyl-transferring) E1 component subunit alpha [Candidatus Sericytochromatia bacterium]|nr:pyruvate dehydrogenase (acetyl-transferring) E1 component subunit alpha [Candidatus Sericytochromatia bacterium]
MASVDPLEMYRGMLLIRRFEGRAGEMYAYGKIGGFLHLYIGEEAIAVGAIRATRPDDDVIGHYRDHGYALARGLSPRAVMAELYGKATGCCGGRGGSMHLADAKRHFWGGHAIVSGHVPIAVGMAFARQQQGAKTVVLDFFGDGATQHGYWPEALNMASLWRLPVVFICEDNRYGMGTALSRAGAQEDIAKRAVAYDMPGLRVDGMDPVAVHEAVSDAVALARRGDGPSLLVCDTYRLRGHSMADPEAYRHRDEVATWRERDPIIRLAERLKQSKRADDGTLHDIEVGVMRVIDDAVTFAEESPDPSPDTLMQDIYARPVPLEAAFSERR